jgi:hypothetical protein
MKFEINHSNGNNVCDRGYAFQAASMIFANCRNTKIGTETAVFRPVWFLRKLSCTYVGSLLVHTYIHTFTNYRWYCSVSLELTITVKPFSPPTISVT